MTPFAAAIKDALRPRDQRAVVDWASEYVRYIPNSARSKTGFQIDAAPWLREPLDYWGNVAVKEQVLILPTGAGKTTFFDVTIPHCIAENPGDVLLSMQTREDAESHIETRLLPTLKRCAPVKKIFDALDRHKLKKHTLVLPHMTLHTAGESKNDYQRISVRYVMIDEAWLLKHGYVGEARARLHDRWDGRVAIVSQGGEQHIVASDEKRETELFSAWRRSDCRKWSMVCPECGGVSAWRTAGIRYAESDDDAEVMESARYHCDHCPAIFEDKPEVRRALSASSRYVATNPNALPFHHGWTAQAAGLFHETWGNLALGWKKANQAKKNGDVSPLKIYIQKRMAEFWVEDEDAPEVVLGSSGYTVGDYAEGALIDGEVVRFMAIDRQRDYFFAGIRAFRADGTSRLLYYSKVATIEQCRALQNQYKIKDDFTTEDASHRPTDVYDDCAKFGWVAMFGDDELKGFDHLPKVGRAVRKLYSPIKKAMASDGTIVRYIRWAVTPVKDILFAKLAGRGPEMQVPDDIGEEWHEQIRGEVKKTMVSPKTKKESERYVKIKRRNDACDVEGMMLTFALIKGVATPEISETTPEEPIDEPAEEANSEPA